MAIYYDDSGNRIHRPVRRRTPPADSGPDDAKTRYIRQVAEENPRSTPDEVHAEIYYVRGCRDISKEMVRAVLA